MAGADVELSVDGIETSFTASNDAHNFLNSSASFLADPADMPCSSGLRVLFIKSIYERSSRGSRAISVNGHREIRAPG